MNAPPRLVVVGGGISGLAAAQGAVEAAGRAGNPIEVTVLEAESSVGGKVRTIRDGDWLVEGGPTGFLDNEPALRELVGAAGMNGDLLPADAAAARRFLVRGGKLREVKANPLAFAASGLLGPTGLLRVLAEPFISRRRDGADESVWSFAARRLGRQVADRLVSPMVLGVFAGDAQALSLPSAFPRLAALEEEHGSLVRGMFARRKTKGAGGPTGPAGTLTSFRSGLESFTDAIARRGGFEVRCGARVSSVRPAAEGGWKIRVDGDGEDLDARGVVLAGEPWAMAPLVRPWSTEMADAMDAIHCPPVAVVALGFAGADAARVPRGFGALIPRTEGFRMLGCLWDTHLFPGRSPAGRVLVRAMFGGAVDEEAARLPHDRLIEITRTELSRLLGIGGEPVFHHVVAWPRAIPQYTLGHAQRVEAIEGAAASRDGMFVTGNALHGVAFAKSAAAGRGVGARASRRLAEAPAASAVIK